MSTETKTPKKSSANTAPSSSTSSRPDTVQQRREVQLDDTGAVAAYANFCRVSGTPEELIIDFGLNPQPFGVPAEPISVSQRLIINHYTAKRLHGALQVALSRHEAAFGAIETDVQKRVMPGAVRRQAGGGA